MISPPLLRRLLITLLLFPLVAGGETNLNSDRAALLTLRISVGRTALQWNETDSPCTWHGVGCLHNRVVFLHLPAVRLFGEIPVGTLGNLTALRSLSLRFNNLSGSLPPDLTGAAQLRTLNLQENRFSGDIPPVLFSMPKLIRLNLAGNRFSGGISPDFNNLFKLETLYLERNQLSGGIPDLNLPKIEQFNVSYNRLNGSMPPNLWKMPSSAFKGTSLCGGPLPPCPSRISPMIVPEAAGGGGGSKLSGGAIAGIAVGSTALVVILLILFVLSCSKARAREGAAMVAKRPEVVLKKPDIGKRLMFLGSVGAPEFDLEDLLRASAEVLGKGKFGTAYKAEMEGGTVVVVKRLRDVILTEEEFREKIEAVGCMNHENIVPIRAYYYSENAKLLVYDYMPMGSISALLHGNRRSGRTSLNWETRISIALSAARGVGYIHSTSPTTFHGNIKSSNIFFNKSNTACVSDNGLAAIINPSSYPNLLSSYRAPELTSFRKSSQKADVYSFGVLLLELLTGKSPEEGINLPQLVQEVLREEWSTDVLDMVLLGQQNVEEMVQLLQIAINCTVQCPDSRPSMAEVVAQIEVISSSSRDAAKVQAAPPPPPQERED